ncbi:MAG: TerC family protein [Planctomycetes bacterium]|nr:TerC family protein [Planctomycetota bacterium]
MEDLFTGPNVIALLTLTALEIVLGIDNVIFLAILTGKLPEKDRPRARFIGLGLAMGARIGLLLGISWVMRLTADLFSTPAILGVESQGISGKDLILILGGLFLIGKSTHEIHAKLEHAEDGGGAAVKPANFVSIIIQIIIIDLVFSLDSVITAVGMVKDVRIMIAAVIVAIIVMMVFAGRIGAFVERHPTIKILALSFLILIGVMLVAEGFGQHVNKGYIYFAMAFSLVVEVVNMRLRKKSVAMVGGITGNSRPGPLEP